MKDLILNEIPQILSLFVAISEKRSELEEQRRHDSYKFEHRSANQTLKSREISIFEKGKHNKWCESKRF